MDTQNKVNQLTHWEEKFDRIPMKKTKKHKVSGKSVFDIQKIITKKPKNDQK